MQKFFLLALCVTATLAVTIPLHYPLYKQCDQRWGNQLIDTKTVCAVGCLMSSVSMALGGHNISIDGQQSNPGTLNQWLKRNGGYSGNDLIESKVDQINSRDVSYTGRYVPANQLPMSKVKEMVASKTSVVIANVLHGAHFVLVVGYTDDDSTIYVNDPGFSRSSYPVDSALVGWRVYHMDFA